MFPVRDLWHGEQKPGKAGHRDTVYEEDVFPFFLIHKTGMKKIKL